MKDTEYQNGYIEAKCYKCKQKKKYSMDMKINYTPMCDKCFIPMLPTKIVNAKMK